MKTEGHLRSTMYRVLQPLTLLMLAVITVISLWTPMLNEAVFERWFSLPNLFFFLPVPLLVLGCTWLILKSAKRQRFDSVPFLAALMLIFLGFTGLGISIWPTLIPPAVSFRDAAGPSESLGFMLVGALFIIPVILVYTYWSYYVFRGKITPEQGYH